MIGSQSVDGYKKDVGKARDLALIGDGDGRRGAHQASQQPGSRPPAKCLAHNGQLDPRSRKTGSSAGICSHGGADYNSSPGCDNIQPLA
jgi:hypothetical protein